MIIEEMRLSDIEVVCDLEKKIFKDPWPKKFFEDDYNNDFSNYFVLKDNEEIIGYAGIWYMFENCDLVNIAIRNDKQGQGLGEKLLRFVIRKAIIEGCEFMHLEVRVGNDKARSLYKKYGFMETRLRKGYYEDGEDCIDMVKGLLGLSEKDFSD